VTNVKTETFLAVADLEQKDYSNIVLHKKDECFTILTSLVLQPLPVICSILNTIKSKKKYRNGAAAKPKPIKKIYNMGDFYKNQK